MLWDAEKEDFGQLHELNEHLYYVKGRAGYPIPFNFTDPFSATDQFAYRQVNLMAVFFDVLLLDEEILVYKSYYTRTERLASLITATRGEVRSRSIRIPVPLLTSRPFFLESFTFASTPSNPQPKYCKKSSPSLENVGRKGL